MAEERLINMPEETPIAETVAEKTAAEVPYQVRSRVEDLARSAERGDWGEVEKLYESYPDFSTIDIAINRGIGITVQKKPIRGTALHLAVSDDNEKVVRNLVNSIIKHNKMEAFKCKNEKGDTPLHIAASRGFKDICELIIGQNGERKHLIVIDNNNGESPVFLSALFWRKQTFLYLFYLKLGLRHGFAVFEYSCTPEGLIRNDGDSILHCAIRKEYFDLALIMVYLCPFLVDIPNARGVVPLKLLATRPSAFKSGFKMIWWKRILYHCIPVGILDVKEAVKYYYEMKQYESSSFIYMLGVEEIRKMKQKHTWSGQLLNILIRESYELYSESIFQLTGYVSESETDLKISETLITDAAILTAARNGIIEIVDVLITQTPYSIYEVNSENKNVLLVAVENRRINVVEGLRKRFEKNHKMEIFDNLIQAVDKKENTVLHLVAKSDQDWNISGAALKIMWHINWFQYTKGLLPKDYTVRTNKLGYTAGELFKRSYGQLIQDGSTWFKDTSESCSVVAALLAGVSFATSSTIPGGNNSETGKPTLEGRPAFDAFALSSVLGLCFSVTSLVVFLSVLTSRKEPKDFRIDLPRKLLLGLSFLFLSIVAMITAFCSGHYFLLDHKFKHFVFLIYGYTCFPVTLYALVQLQLYTDLLRSIATKVPKTGDKGEDL